MTKYLIEIMLKIHLLSAQQCNEKHSNTIRIQINDNIWLHLSIHIASKSASDLLTIYNMV